MATLTELGQICRVVTGRADGGNELSNTLQGPDWQKLVSPSVDMIVAFRGGIVNKKGGG